MKKKIRSIKWRFNSGLFHKQSFHDQHFGCFSILVIPTSC